MPTMDVEEWAREFSRPGAIWLAKRLSPNDTQLTGGKQAGPLIPKAVALAAFPELSDPETRTVDLTAFIDSHTAVRNVNLKWYNSKKEAHLTRWGGRSSPLLDPENTGALIVFAFIEHECHVWLCDDSAGLEAEFFEDLLGPVEPKRHVSALIGEGGLAFVNVETAAGSCWLPREDIPPSWLLKMPSGEEIIRKAAELRPLRRENADRRLMRRRDCEFQLFKSIEQEFFLPKIQVPFQDIQSFLAIAQKMTQSRRTRSGRSLELHTAQILVEENFVKERDFSHGSISEGNKKPDFLFPSQAAYRDPSFDKSKLRMLGIKTTCKDRWRQILNEADRVESKHLLTLQEGISENQFREMVQAKICLVVPQELHSGYPASVRSELCTIEGFLAEVRALRT